MSGANIFIFTVVSATVSIAVKTRKNNTVDVHNRETIMFFACCKQFTWYYQFPFAVQTHSFLSTCRHFFFVRKHTQIHTFTNNIVELYDNSSHPFVPTMFYSLCKKRRYLQ